MGQGSRERDCPLFFLLNPGPGLLAPAFFVLTFRPVPDIVCRLISRHHHPSKGEPPCARENVSCAAGGSGRKSPSGRSAKQARPLRQRRRASSRMYPRPFIAAAALLFAAVILASLGCAPVLAPEPQWEKDARAMLDHIESLFIRKQYDQAMKALDFACTAVRPGGAIVLITPCPEGISPTHATFKDRARQHFDDHIRAIKNGEIEDLPVGGALLQHSQILERAKIICYSEGLTNSDKEALGFIEASTPEEAVDMALREQGRKAKIGVLKCGEIVPRV